jgi:glycosyltransferase involved in cell wall biosynthesis
MKKNNIPLSVIILTHRSDQRFLNALKSAQPAKEVLVLDYQSNNDWKKLEKKYHFTLIKRSGPIENFAKERNLGLKKAKHDWILFLDSDEEIVSESWEEIGESIEENSADGFFIKRTDIFYNKPLRFGETGGASFLRLIKKDKAKYLRPIHETASIDGTTEYSRIKINHYSHQNITEFLKDITHYSLLESEYQNDDLLSPTKLGMKTIIYPKAKFINNYIFKLGFLDGWRGLAYASMMSLHSLMVRVFSYENN